MEHKVMKQIIAIIGESGSGKTLLAEYIENKYGFKLLESYTDRPKRSEHEIGHTFISRKEFNNIPVGNMIAYTNFGGYNYCCLKSQLEQVNVYVIDEKGYSMLMSNKDTDNTVFSIRIKRDLDLRIEDIGYDRVARDEGFFNMKDDKFDVVIYNNNTKEEFFRQVDSVIAFKNYFMS